MMTSQIPYDAKIPLVPNIRARKKAEEMEIRMWLRKMTIADSLFRHAKQIEPQRGDAERQDLRVLGKQSQYGQGCQTEAKRNRQAADQAPADDGGGDLSQSVLVLFTGVDPGHNQRGAGDAGAQGAVMTGTGSAVFGVFRDENKAERTAEGLGKEYPFSVTAVPKGMLLV